MKITDEVKTFISQKKLMRSGDRIIIGVSGGPDSVALLSLLNNLKHDLGLQLHIVHVNHKLRSSADRDQRFVEQLAGKLNIPILIHISQPSSHIKGSLEDFARNERQKFFKRVIRKTGYTSVALAHTKDDLAETVMMRIIRGAGLQGMRAIIPDVTIDTVRYIRPLLSVSKDDILKYLVQKKMDYKTDPTNKETKFFRNKMRLKLLPLLAEKYNPQIKDALVNLSISLADDFDYMRTQTEKSYKRIELPTRLRSQVKLDLAKLMNQPISIRRMILRKAYVMLKGDSRKLTYQHLEEVRALIDERPVNSTVHWPYSICVKKIRNVLVFSKRNKS